MRSQSVPAKRAGNAAEVVGGAGREVERCGAGDDGLPGAVAERCGAADVVRAGEGVNGTTGTDDELTELAGGPAVPAPPLPQAATDATASVMHAVNPSFTNDRADMALTA